MSSWLRIDLKKWVRVTDSYFIYLAGGMTGLTYEEQTCWREQIEKCLNEVYKSELYNVHTINPVKYYNFEKKRHKTEREVMNFDLHKVRNSNLVIANFFGNKSLGTMAELTVAHEHHIPIIGLNENNNELHPWQECFCERIFNKMDDLLDYVAEFYLN